MRITMPGSPLTPPARPAQAAPPARPALSALRALPALAALAALAIAPAAAHAQSAPDASEVIVFQASDVEWAAGPPSLPPGASFALLEGDPSKAVPLTFRLRFPPNYRVPPHYHSVIEHVTVLRGTLHVGMGESEDRSQGVALTAGSFAAMPAEMVHYAWTGADGVEFQLHSVGPWSITYIDPDDDPRNAAASR